MKRAQRKLNMLNSKPTYEEKLGLVWGIIHTDPTLSFQDFKTLIYAARKPIRSNEDPESIMG